MNYKTIHDRYMKNYITDEQLERFVKLGIITQEQADKLYQEKHPESASLEENKI